MPLDTGDVTVTSDNGGITDGTAAEDALVIADTAAFSAATGIGGAEDLDLSLTSDLTLTNSGATGDIVITQLAIGGAMTVAAFQSDGLGDGNIVILVESGDLKVRAAGIDVAGAGLVSLTGAVGAILIDGNIATASGDIGLTASGIVSQNADITVAGGSGHIAIQAGGAITMAAGTKSETAGGYIVYTSTMSSLVLDQIVTAAGNVRLDAQGGNTTLNGNVSAAGGFISVLASAGVEQEANLSAGGDGTIDVSAAGGDITMSDGAIGQTADANIRYTATGGIVLGEILAGSGDVSLVALSGGITDADGAAGNDVSGHGLRITAGTNVGSGGDHIETAVDILAVAADGPGGLFITNSQAAVIAGVAVSVRRVQTDGSATDPDDLVTDAVLSDLAATGGGNVVLLLSAGDLTVTDGSDADTAGVSASAAGNILLSTAVGTIDIQAPVGSESGFITVSAASAVIQFADLSTGGTGTIDVAAAGGDITMADTVASQTAGGNIRYAASGSIQLGELTAGTGDVSLVAMAGSITDADAANGNDVTAVNLRIAAGTDVGNSGDHIETTVDNMAVSAGGAGGIFITNSQAATVSTVSVSVRRVQSDGTAVAPDDLVTDAVLSGLTTTDNGGDIVLISSAGDLTLTDGVTADGDGNVLVSSAAGTVDIQAAVASTAGCLSVSALTAISQGANLSTGGAGTIDVWAANGDITMADTIFGQTAGGNIRYAAGGNLQLGELLAGDGSVSLVAAAGSITDADAGADNDITAAGLRIAAGLNVGAGGDPIETTIGSLTATAGGAGGIFITNSQAAAVSTIGVAVLRVQSDGTAVEPDDLVTDADQNGLTTNANGGDIVLTAEAGDLSVLQTVTAGSDGNVRLSTGTGAIEIQQTVTSAAGIISIVAATSVDQSADITTGGGGTLDVEALSGDITMADGTIARTIDAHIRYAASGSLQLSEILAGAGDVSIIAAAGSITDADGNTGNDVTADELRIFAGLDIGSGSDHLETAVNEMSASAGGAAGAFLTNNQTLRIASVAVTVQRVEPDGVADNPQVDAALGDIVTLSNGDIVVVTAGDLTVSNPVTADGDGNVLLQSDLGIQLDADVTSGSGHITILAGTSLTQAADITTGGGTVDAAAATGALTMAAGVTSTGGGNLRYTAFTGITITTIAAGAGSVALSTTAGSITETGDLVADVSAQSLRLTAGYGIGVAADTFTVNGIETDVAVVTAFAGPGGVALVEEDDVAIGAVDVRVSRVTGDATTRYEYAEVQSGVRATDGGFVAVSNLAGNITVLPSPATAALYPDTDQEITLVSDAGGSLYNGYNIFLEESDELADNAATAVFDAINSELTITVSSTGETTIDSIVLAVNDAEDAGTPFPFTALQSAGPTDGQTFSLGQAELNQVPSENGDNIGGAAEIENATTGGEAAIPATVSLLVGPGYALRITASQGGLATNGVLVRLLDDGPGNRLTDGADEAVALYDDVSKRLDIYLNNGATTVQTVVDCINEANAADTVAMPFTAAVTGTADGTETIHSLPVVTVNQVPPSVGIQPAGDNNDMQFTASQSGTGLNGVTIRFLDDGTVSGNAAAVSYNVADKILTVKITNGITDAAAVVEAVNNHGLFSAILDTTSETGNTGFGTIQADITISSDQGDGQNPYAVMRPAGNDNDFEIVPWGGYDDVEILLVAGDTFAVTYDDTARTLTVRVKNELPYTNAQAVIDAINSDTIPFNAAAIEDQSGIGGIETVAYPLTSGGIGNTAQATLDPYLSNNQILFTAKASGSDWAGVTVWIMDDGTVDDGSADVSYNGTDKILTIKIQSGVTTAAAVIAAVTADAGLPFSAANSGSSSGAGKIHTSAAETSGGFDAVPAGISLALPGAANDIRLSADVAGADANDVTVVLIHDGAMAQSVAASYDDTDALHRVLSIHIKNNTTTADDIVAWFTADDTVPFSATATEGDGSGVISTAAVIHATAGAGAVVMDAAESLFVEAAITTGLGSIGLTAGGDINFSGAAGRTSSASATELTAGGSLANTGSVTALTIAAAGLGDDVTITTGAQATASTQNLVIDSRGGVTVNGSGLALDGANLTITADDNILVNAPIDASADTVTLAAEDHVATTASGPITAAILDIDAGTDNSDDGDATLQAPVTGGTVDVNAYGTIQQKADITVGDTSTVTLTARTGAVTMADTTTTTTASGNATLQAATHIDLSTIVSATGFIELAAGEAITDNTVLESPNLTTGSSALLAAVSGIGDYNAGDIDTSVKGIEATNSGLTGHIVIEESAAGIGIEIDKLLQSNAAGIGNIVLSSLDGTITVTDAGSGIEIRGAGSLRLQAGDLTDPVDTDIVIEAVVSLQAGSATLTAADGIDQQADITTTGGDITVRGAAGTIVMASGTKSASAGGNLLYRAGAGITVSRLNAGAGSAAIVTDTGDVLDDGALGVSGDLTDVTAAAVLIQATSGSIGELGDGGTAIETDVATIAAVAGGGHINLAEVTSVTVDAVSVSTTGINLDGTPSVTASAMSDLTSNSGGAIVLRTMDGSLTVTGGGDDTGVTAAGNLLLQAGVLDNTPDSDLRVDGDILSAGTASLVAARHVDQNADIQIAGIVDLEAVGGGIDMDAANQTRTAGAGIRYAALGDIVLGTITAGAGSGTASIVSTAGSILDNGEEILGTDIVDVAAGGLRLSAAIAVGELSGSGMGPLDLAVTTVSAGSGIGGIHLLETDDLTVDKVGMQLSRVMSDGTVPGVADVSDPDQSDLTTVNGGSITVGAGGHLLLNDGDADGLAVWAATSGIVGLAAADITVNASVKSLTGTITLLATTGSILQNRVDPGGGGSIVYGHLTTTNAQIQVLAPAGSITTVNGAATTSGGSGDVTYTALGDILVGGIDAGTGDLWLTAGDAGNVGSVLDNGDATVDLAGSALVLNTSGSAGVLGALADALETNITTSTVSAGADISLLEADSVTLIDLYSATGGIVVITRDGSVTVIDGPDADNLGLVAATAGNIRLAAGNDDQLSAVESVTLNAAVQSGSGSITVTSANGDITLAVITDGGGGVASQGDILTVGGSGTIDMEAAGGSVVMADGTTAATNNQNIRIKAAQGIQVADIIAGSGSVSIAAGTGSVTDADGEDGNDVIAGQLRISAGGDVGSVQPMDTLETTVAVMAVEAAGTNGIYVTNSIGLTVSPVDTVPANRVGSDGLATEEADAETLADLATTANGGDIRVTVLTGDLVLVEGGDDPVTATAVIRPMGDNNDLVISAPLPGIGFNGTTVEFVHSNLVAPGGCLATYDAVTKTLTINIDAGVTTAETVITALVPTGFTVSLDTSLEAGNNGGGTIGPNVPDGVTADGDDTTKASANVELEGDDNDLTITAPAVGSAYNNIKIAFADDGTVTGDIAVVSYDGGSKILTVTVDTGTTTAAAIMNAVNAGADGFTAALYTAQETENDGSGTIGLQLEDTSLASGDNGPAVVADQDGNITLNVVEGAMRIDGDVRSATGNVGLFANGDVVHQTGSTVKTAGTGAVTVASGGSIDMKTGSYLQATGAGSTRLLALTNIVAGTIDGGDGVTSLVAVNGGIFDNDDADSRVSGTNLRLQAITGIGEIGAGNGALEIDATLLSGVAAAGDISLAELDSVAVDSVGPVYTQTGSDIPPELILALQSLAGVDAAAAAVLEAPQADLVTATSGAIEVTFGNAKSYLQDGDGDGHAILSAGTVTITNASAVVVSSDIIAAAGISFLGTGDIQTSADMQVTLTGGGVFIDRSRLVLLADSQIQAASGNITLDEVVTSADNQYKLTLLAGAGDVLIDDNTGTATLEPGGLTVVTSGDFSLSGADATVNLAGPMDIDTFTMTWDAPVTITNAGTLTVTNSGTAVLNGKVTVSSDILFDGAGDLMLSTDLETTGASAAYDYAVNTLTITIQNGVTTANSVIAAITSGTGFNASLDTANEAGNDGTGVLTDAIADLTMTGGDADNNAAAQTTPEGGNNDLIITAPEKGDQFNGLTITFVDDGTIAGDTATASFAFDPISGATISVSASKVILTGDRAMSTSNGDIDLEVVSTNTDGAHVLTLATGEGHITIHDTVGAADLALAGLTVESAMTTWFEAPLFIAGPVDIDTGQWTMDGPLTTTAGGVVTVTAADGIYANALMTAAGQISLDGEGTIYLAADLVTTDSGAGVDIPTATVMLVADDRNITTNDGAVTLDEIQTDTSGDHILTITAGSGEIIVDDNVGVHGGSILGGLTVASAGSVHFSGTAATVDAAALTIGQLTPVGDLQMDAAAFIAGSVDINTATITLDGTINTTSGGTVTVTNTGDAHLNKKITSASHVLFDGSGTVQLAASIQATEAGASITVSDSTLTLTDDNRVLTTNNGDITLDTVSSDTDGDHVLTLAAGTGNILVDDVVGPADEKPAGLQVTSSLSARFDAAVAVAGPMDINTTDLTFNGTVNSTAGGTVTVTHSGTAFINAKITSAGALLFDGPGTILLAAAIETTDPGASVSTTTAAIVLTGGDRFVTTNNGAVALGVIATDTPCDHVLTITAGTGDVTFGGPVGTAVAPVGALSVVSAGDVRFESAADVFSCGQVTATAVDDIRVFAAVTVLGDGMDIVLAAGSDGQGRLFVETGGQLSAGGANSGIRLTTGAVFGDIELAGDVSATQEVQITAPSGAIEQSAGTVSAASVVFRRGRCHHWHGG